MTFATFKSTVTFKLKGDTASSMSSMTAAEWDIVINEAFYKLVSDTSPQNLTVGIGSLYKTTPDSQIRTWRVPIEDTDILDLDEKLCYPLATYTALLLANDPANIQKLSTMYTRSVADANWNYLSNREDEDL